MQAFGERAVVRPVDSIDSTHCPTRRSGSPPRDAVYETAIAAQG